MAVGMCPPGRYLGRPRRVPGARGGAESGVPQGGCCSVRRVPSLSVMPSLQAPIATSTAVIAAVTGYHFSPYGPSRYVDLLSSHNVSTSALSSCPLTTCRRLVSPLVLPQCAWFGADGAFFVSRRQGDAVLHLPRSIARDLMRWRADVEWFSASW